MNTRDVIQSLWVGEKISKLERLCMKSFLAHGHPFHLYIYHELGGIPSDVCLMDANEIIPENDIQTYPLPDHASRSDWFRQKLLSLNGGWWVDMDVVCLKPFDFTNEIVFSHEGDYFTNSILKFPANHPLTNAMSFWAERPYDFPPWKIESKRGIPRPVPIYRAWKHWNRRRSGYRWHWGEVAGPKPFSRAVHHYGLSKYGLASNLLMDVNMWSSRTLFKDAENGWPIHNDAMSVHFYNNSISRADMDKDANYSPGSPFEILKCRYGV